MDRKGFVAAGTVLFALLLTGCTVVVVPPRTACQKDPGPTPPEWITSLPRSSEYFYALGVNGPTYPVMEDSLEGAREKGGRELLMSLGFEVKSVSIQISSSNQGGSSLDGAWDLIMEQRGPEVLEALGAQEESRYLDRCGRCPLSKGRMGFSYVLMRMAKDRNALENLGKITAQVARKLPPGVEATRENAREAFEELERMELTNGR